ncbi:hypothetical protein [Pelagerythrobacter sp.]|uniref:hypothetical protein n=1 Tax=Pelagerythrobacter sp. TaxID=2800702 RepID=UPI0035AF2183
MNALKQRSGSAESNALKQRSGSPTENGSERLRVWQGIEAADPPEKARDYADLLEMAELMLEARRKRFPALVASGDLTAEEADRQIATHAEIAAEWRWIASGEGDPASLLTLHDRRAALDDSLSTIASIARRRGGFGGDLAHQAQCVIALRWHLEPGRDTVGLAALTHQLRREARIRAERPARENAHVQ